MVTVAREANGGARAVAFSPTSKLLAVGAQSFDKDSNGSTTEITVAHAMTGIMEWSQKIPGYAMPAAFSPDGKSILAFTGGNAIRLIDAESGTLKTEIAADQSGDILRWNCCFVSPRAHLLVIGGISKKTKGLVEVWDLGGGSATVPAKDAGN